MKKLVFSLVLVFAAFTVQAQKIEFKYKINKKENYVTITGWKGKGTRIVIPDEIKGYPVTVIGKNAFQMCRNVNHVVLPRNLRYIPIIIRPYNINDRSVKILLHLCHQCAKIS